MALSGISPDLNPTENSWFCLKTRSMTDQGQEKSREVVKYPDSIMADGC